jgi:hypothetical protein
MPMWTADHVLFLVAVAAAIAFLVGGEVLGALRSRVPVPVRLRRRRDQLPPESLHSLGLD